MVKMENENSLTLFHFQSSRTTYVHRQEIILQLILSSVQWTTSYVYRYSRTFIQRKLRNKNVLKKRNSKYRKQRQKCINVNIRYKIVCHKVVQTFKV